MILAVLLPVGLLAQGNKLSIGATVPKSMTVCGITDTTRVSVYNISSGSVTGLKITLKLPAGVKYLAGTVTSSGVSEFNITDLNQPVFSGPSLLVAQNFAFRVRLSANCDIMPLLSGSNNPEIKVRIDYSGNFDEGGSLPFLPALPSPGFASIGNQSFTGNLGDKFVRTLTFTNYGKGPQTILRLVRVNGKDFTTQPEKGFSNSKSSDTVFTLFGAADFKKIGDKDTLFEENESIIIHDTIVITGCNSLTTTYLLQWGCEGKMCQTLKSNAQISISSQNPVIYIWTSSKYSTCYDPTVKHKQEFYFTNGGKLPAKNTIISLSRYYSSYSIVDTSSMKIRLGKNGTPKKYLVDSFGLGNAIPCMPGKYEFFNIWFRFPEVKVGDTFYITWDEQQCQQFSCNGAYWDANWYVYGQYQNQCKTLNTIASLWGKYPVYTYAAASTLYPTDLAPSKSKLFRYTFNSFSSFNTDTNSRIRIDFIMPKNLSHSMTKADFYIADAQFTSYWYPDSIVMIGDTLRGYMGRSFAISLVNGELNVRFTGSCAKSTKNENLPLTMKLKYNTNVNCHPNKWIEMCCITTYTKVHCSKACNGGMRFVDFEIGRTSFGLPDNDNDGLADGTGKLDTSKLRTERVMYGDTFQTVFVGRPVNRGTTNNWRYGYAQTYMPLGRVVDVVSARIEVYRYGSLYSGTCNRVKHQKSVTGNAATFFFDFTIDSIYKGGCMSASARYTANDSVRLIVSYRVNGNYGASAYNFTCDNRFYLSTVSTPSLSQSYQCDTFSGAVSLFGYNFVNYGPDNIIYSNCAETWLHQFYYLGIGPCCNNYAGANVFPYEYRNWARPKSLILNLPPGLKLNRTQFGQYRTAGVNNAVLEYKDTILPNVGTSAPYIFDFTKYFKGSGGKINASDDGFHGYFYYSVIPKCDMPPGKSEKITYDYVFERRNAMGSGYDTVFGGADYFTFVPPQFTLKPAIATQYAVSDTVEWEVSYSNPSSSFDAYNIWLSAAKSTNLKVVEVRDKDADTLIKPVVDIYRAGVIGAGKSRRFKVRATYNKCYPDSLAIYGGWNCEKYPDDFASYPCKPDRTTLFIEPQNTRLQLTLTDSVSTVKLCATNKFTLLVENVQAVAAYKTKVQVTLPIGVEIVPAASSLRYPLNSSAKSLADPVLVSGTTYEWDLAKLNTTLGSGFKGTTDTSKNKILITFRVKTNCDYASGSFLRSRALANIRCGDPVVAIPAFSNPIDIQGVTRPYYTLMRLWSDTLKICEKPTEARARVIFLGPGKSGTNDRVEFFLPNGVKIDSSYFINIRNAPNKDSFYVRDYNGAKLYSWLLPSKISPGDSIEFKVRVVGNSKSVFCGTYDLLGRSVVVQPIVCVTTNQPCDIKVITGGELISPVVSKASLILTQPSITSAIVSGDSEQMVLNYKIKNTSVPNGIAQPVMVKYYFDKDANGSVSSGDIYLGKDSLNINLKKDSLVPRSKSLKVKAGYSCSIMAIIDSAACSCSFGELSFPPPVLYNAGADSGLCSGSKFVLGNKKVSYFKYKWSPSVLVNNDTLANPSFTGTNVTGTPQVNKLILQTQRGLCVSKDTVQVTLYPNPEIVLNLHDSALCENHPVSVNAKVIKGNGGFTYQWNTSKGLSDSTQSKVVIKARTTAWYKIRVTDQKKCKAEDSLQLTIKPYPVIDFTWPNTCFGDTVLVTDKSTISQGNIAWTTWKTPFGDTLNAKKIKVSTGPLSKINLSLIAGSDYGCLDTLSKWVDVKAIPKNTISAGQNGCIYDSLAVKGSVFTDSGNIVLQKWIFSDGTTINNQLIAKHKFALPGKYSVLLISQNNFGCTDTAADSLSVYPKPLADFTVNNVCAYDSIKLKNQSSVTAGENIVTYHWQTAFAGDFYTPNVALKPPVKGSYAVGLKIISSHNCLDSVSKTVKVFEVPKAQISTKNVCLGINSLFTDSSKGSNIVKYNWNLGDNTVSIQQNPSHLYAVSGNYNVKLKITTLDGCADSTVTPHRVNGLAKPFAAVNNLCLKEPLNAVMQYTGTGVPLWYRWKLGNGDSVNTAPLNYTYPLAGNYTIQLIAQTDSGCRSDTFLKISVYDLPQIQLTANNPCMDDSVVFGSKVTLTGGALVSAYQWRFADGSNAANASVNRLFKVPGNYNAVLGVASDKGCKDSANINYPVYQKVYKGFKADAVCEGEPVVFTNTSKAGLAFSSFDWNFGDGKTSSTEHPVHLYNQSGNYNVKLKLQTLAGCFYDTAASVVVYPLPVPGFNTGSGTGTILNPEITVTDESIGADSIDYKTSDGFLFKQPDFVHKFPDSGTYTILQRVSTKAGCKDSLSKQVVIYFIYTLHVPGVFTPDGDDLNEVFKPMGMGIKWFSMKVFTRWGEMIYETADSKGWDGTYKGQHVGEGVYAVLITVRDYKNERHYYRGTVTVLR